MTSKSALLVIDIQKDNVSLNSPYPYQSDNVETLIERVNTLKQQFDENQLPVIFVRQVFQGLIGNLISRLLLKGITLKNQPGTELDERLYAIGSQVIDKPGQNAFHKTTLNSELLNLGIKHLYIAGLDGAYCIAQTAKGGLAANYRVTLIDDAIITNKPKKWEALKESLLKSGAEVNMVANVEHS